ncbi:MAG: hypothetical protein LBF37_00795 [Rickettsiales bacterium]|jgi:hypothetical protein|nr:hypothetical protein [Rickettsiales bacterium]
MAQNKVKSNWVIALAVSAFLLTSCGHETNDHYYDCKDKNKDCKDCRDVHQSPVVVVGDNNSGDITIINNDINGNNNTVGLSVEEHNRRVLEQQERDWQRNHGKKNTGRGNSGKRGNDGYARIVINGNIYIYTNGQLVPDPTKVKPDNVSVDTLKQFNDVNDARVRSRGKVKVIQY